VQAGGETALFIVCNRGFLDMLEVLLEDGRSNYNKPNTINQTPLFIASYNGKPLGTVRVVSLQRAALR
jgi:hypothetical protein